jgi:hypothetical protein
MTQPATHPHSFHPEPPSALRAAAGINVIAGLYVLISTWIASANTGDAWNGIIVGIVVTVLAAMRFSGSTGVWASWINALLGIWLIISPWVYRYAGTGQETNTIVLGIIVLVLGLWGASASRGTMPSA